MFTNYNYKDRAFKMIGDWKAQSKKLKEKFSILTDKDLIFLSDTHQEDAVKPLLRRLEQKLNKKRQDVIELIKSVQRQTTK